MTRRTFRTERQPIRRILAVPLLLAAASLAGVILALTGDGLRDAFAALLLTLPLAVFAIAWARRG